MHSSIADFPNEMFYAGGNHGGKPMPRWSTSNDPNVFRSSERWRDKGIGKQKNTKGAPILWVDPLRCCCEALFAIISTTHTHICTVVSQ